MSLRRSTPPVSSFVGRSHDLAQLTQRLSHGGVVVVVGPPGVGKTRLVRQFAQQSWRDAEVIWLDAGALDDEDQLAAGLSRALEIPESAPEPEADELSERAARWQRLGRGLSSRGPLLLVLNHVEHLVEVTAHAIEALTRHAPEVRVVATSRVRLALPEERCHTHLLSPLAPPRSRSPADVAACESVQLLSRASGLIVSEESAATLAELVEQLDGLPLALELAARRLRLLSPASLLSRLHERLDLFKERPEGLTLRETLQSSWDALNAAERLTLSRCAVFRGPFRAEACEVMFAEGELDGGAQVLDALDGLVDHSLVQTSGEPSAPRLRMLESIRQFAIEQLSPGDLDTLRLRHARHAAAAPVDVEDIDNLVEAYHHVATREGAEAASLRVAILLKLDPLVSTHMPARSRLVRLDETLTASERGGQIGQAELAQLLRLRGVTLQHLGRMDEAEADLTRALDLTGREGEAGVLLQCLLGHMQLARGRPLFAQEHFEHARSAASRLHDVSALRGRAALGLGLLAHSRGRLDDAQALYEEAAHHLRLCGAPSAVAEALAYLGAVWLQRGRLPQARVSYEDALTLLEESRDHRLLAMTLGNLALLVQEEGLLVEAQTHLERGLAAARHVGDRMLEGHLVGYQGCLRHEQGQLAQAQRAYEHALALLREVGDVRQEAIFLACLGSVCAMRGMPDAAQAALDQADALLASVGDAGAQGAVSLHRGQLLLAQARDRGTASAESNALLESVQALLDAGRADPLYWQSDDLRLSLRLLSTSLAADALVFYVDDEGPCSFRMPEQPQQDLANRAPLRRLLGALLGQRQRASEGALSDEELIAASWPGERIEYTASMNRLKVAITTLRKLGLRDALLRGQGGYLLDPKLPIRVERAGQAPLV